MFAQSRVQMIKSDLLSSIDSVGFASGRRVGKQNSGPDKRTDCPNWIIVDRLLYAEQTLIKLN